MAKILVVEDHALVREGLVRTLRQMDSGTEVFEASNSSGASALLEQGTAFDLMLLDLGLPGIDGLSYLGNLQINFPEMPVVVLSAYDDAHTVGRVMKHGATAFVPKSCSGEQLLEVLRDVLAGKKSSLNVSAQTEDVSLPRAPIGGNAEPSEFGLTARQAEVLGLMARGKSNRDIAHLLHLSEGTVKIHMTAIFKALGVSSRTQAMVVIARHGIRV